MAVCHLGRSGFEISKGGKTFSGGGGGGGGGGGIHNWKLEVNSAGSQLWHPYLYARIPLQCSSMCLVW